MKILFFTDVHLVGKSNINRKDNLVETQIEKLRELIEESKNVDLIISCGDIFNKYDPCCYAGLKYEYYEVELQQIIANLGKGNFSVISDDTHKEHIISDFSLELIEKNL